MSALCHKQTYAPRTGAMEMTVKKVSLAGEAVPARLRRHQ
jgi:hypothetical protein